MYINDNPAANELTEAYNIGIYHILLIIYENNMFSLRMFIGAIRKKISIS